MAARRRRWPYVLFGIAILLVFLGIGVILATVAWFQENMQVEKTTVESAQAEFDSVRQKFGSREPLLQLRNGVPQYTGARERASPTSGTKLTTLNILVWDPDDEQMARIALPFWLLRMKSDPIRFSAYASGLDDEGVDLRPEDIEKYGAGVILDTGNARSERVLLWAQ